MSEQQPDAPAIPGDLIDAVTETVMDIAHEHCCDEDGCTGGSLPFWRDATEMVLGALTEHAGIVPKPDVDEDEPVPDAQDHAGAVLTDGQCERLHRAVAEHEAALKAIRVALDFAATWTRPNEHREIIAAAREALKVLSGEEEACNG